MIEVGKEVTWISQTQCSDKGKTGKVIAIIPAKKDADLLLPHDVKPSHVKYDSHISIYERVLVAVPAGKSGQITHYYCPRKSVLEAQGN